MSGYEGLIASLISTAASVGSTYYNNEQAGQRFDQQMAAMGNNQQANFDFNAGEAMKTRQFALDQWSRGVQQNDLAYARNQSNFTTLLQQQNSAYQRAVGDMKLAGINPILAYQKGGLDSSAQPAQSPTAPSGLPGGQASAGMPSMPSAPRTDPIFSSGMVSSAIQAATARSAVDQAAANVDQTRANTALAAADTQRSSTASALQVLQAQSEGFRPEQIRAETARARAGATLSSAQTATEGYRQTNIGADTGRIRSDTSRIDAVGEREGHVTTDYRNWGPPSSARDAAVTAERIGGRVGGTIRDNADNIGGAIGSARRFIDRAGSLYMNPAQKFIDNIR